MEWPSRGLLKRSDVPGPGPQHLGRLTGCGSSSAGGGGGKEHLVGADAVCSQPGLPPPAVRSVVTTHGCVAAPSTSLCGMGHLGQFISKS